MKPIKITVTGTEACVTEKPVLTSGMVGLPVDFIFDEAWEGLAKTAVFKAGSRSYPVSCVQNAAVVPWEVLEKPFLQLKIGVFGTDGDGAEQIPTVWASVDTIQPGTQIPDTVPKEPTPQVYDQILAAANEAMQIAASVREDADNGVFNGEPGEPGKPGVTDYATDQIAGLVRVGPGLKMAGAILQIHKASYGGLDSRASDYNPIVPSNLDYAIRAALTSPKNVTWTDEHKAGVRELLGVTALVGDIETALDSIIAIQNELIGGESV